MEGYEKGDICNRDGCNGIIGEHKKEGSCSCHISPPCGYCTTANTFCEACGWDGLEEQREHDRKEAYQKNREYYEREQKEFEAARELFWKKYRGEVPADRLEIMTQEHTHFSMKKIGVFPKGTETYESLTPKVKGTFGGRFATEINKDSFKFEYIAYTD